MLTARGDEIDRIVGRDMGADDCLAKPFNPRVLPARVRAGPRPALPVRPIDQNGRLRAPGGKPVPPGRGN